MDMIKRPRRLRGNETLRKMVRETRMDKSSLIYPIFVKDGEHIKEEIPSMEGQYRYSVDQLPYALEEIADAGVSSVMLFGIPDHKDEVGSQAYAEDGIVQRALREAKKQVPQLYYVTDVCMCEYTSHGHCGVLCGQEVENDANPGAPGEDRAESRSGGSGYGSSLRYDGWKSCGDPPEAGRKRIQRDSDYVLRGEIRFRVLRSFP